MTNRSNEEILDDLGIIVEKKQSNSLTPWQQRVVAGFEDIQRFVEEHNRIPNRNAKDNLFEPIYAIRLETINATPEACKLLRSIDTQGLITPSTSNDDWEESEPTGFSHKGDIDKEQLIDITRLTHVRTSAERKAAEMIASRTLCVDFDKFKPLFDQVKIDINHKIRKTRRFELKSEIEEGRFFIVNGQMAYVADKGSEFIQDYGHNDARLRVIYENGTESNVLMRSLQRALNKDKAARRITEAITSPLFSNSTLDPNLSSGTIYVLKSLSSLDDIARNREFIHKIGVTSGSVETRIADAKRDTTYLLADVEIVKTYDMAGYDHRQFERILHKFLIKARLKISIHYNGKEIKPKEWYLIPLEVIDEVVEAILDKSIVSLKYDQKTFSLVKR